LLKHQITTRASISRNQIQEEKGICMIPPILIIVPNEFKVTL